jgi:hypothetical protein
MSDFAEEFDFAMEPFDEFTVGGGRRRKNLHNGDGVRQPILRFVDVPHSAAGDLFEQNVIAKNNSSRTSGGDRRDLKERRSFRLNEMFAPFLRACFFRVAAKRLEEGSPRLVGLFGGH